ncbi:MAG: unsaturated chondroitin disaccharide hydrolase [Rhodothermales bacterium]|jgi:unsaturated chondroitin disaccharide hydrolase
MLINADLTAVDLVAKISDMWTASAAKIRAIEDRYTPELGTPVFTIEGKYTARGWTEWTQGFQYGSAILQFDATGDAEFLEIGRQKTVELMAPHVTHMGVHDHGFNNVSTYGNLLRLMNEGRIAESAGERNFYELALKCSGAVQARRWSPTADGGGYIYSFNGPQSLFADTVRSLRALAVAHQLGHALMDEQDKRVSLLGRLVDHARATAAWNVYYGDGRDSYDLRGRVAHESIFNVSNGVYRCPSSQQGFSPFTTWTRGLAWIICGYPEELEFLTTLDDAELEPYGGRMDIEAMMRKAAHASCDFFIENTCADGIPMWDTGAPNLHRLPADYLEKTSVPNNQWEPVDSSAAAIAAQGLLRFGRYLRERGDSETGNRYWQAGLTTLNTLLSESYLSTDDAHEGLLLHSVYHQPNGWDHVPDGARVPLGESSMWGDYHLRETALYLQRVVENGPYYRFYL